MKNFFRTETIIVTVFFLFLLLPLLDMGFRLDRFKQLNENRQLAKAPQFDLSVNALQNLPSGYTKYFNDHFGFRNAMVRVNFFFKHELLGGSPSKQVVIGKNGWLFYSSEGELEDYRGITKYDEETLRRWATTLEMKKNWLERRGIRYLFVIPPNKSTVYGEFLPDAYCRIREKTGTDELVAYLKMHTDVDIIDLRPSLLAAKAVERLYFKTDTHWNSYGAFLAYREIMKPVVKWFPGQQIKTLDDYRLERKMGDGGDLASMIGGSEFIREENLNLIHKSGHYIRIDGINDNTKSPALSRNNDSSLPRALVFRDSFFTGAAPFLASHFQYSAYYWQVWGVQTPIEEIIRSTKPDIVIEEVVERLLKTGMADFVSDPPRFIANDILQVEMPNVK